MAGKAFVYQKINNLYSEIAVGKEKKNVYEYLNIHPTDLAGGIFKVSNSFGKKIINLERSKKYDGVNCD